jgi:phosphoserine aminotransferase
MPTREEIAYFGAGPAPLPTSVIEAGGKAFVNFSNTGLGLAEISHRSPTANRIIAEAKEAATTLYDIPDSYEILFMQAGGTGEFSAVVQNLVSVWIERRRRKAEKDLGSDEEKIVERLKKEIETELKLDYLVTGSWSLKASQEASRLIGAKYVNVAVDARKASDGKFRSIPAEDTWSLTPTKKEGGHGSAFVYYCDNETVDGVEFPSYPKCLEPQGGDEEDERLVVADMSSNFLSRKIDVSKFAVIFVSRSHCRPHLQSHRHLHRAARRRTWVWPESPLPSSVNHFYRHRPSAHPHLFSTNFPSVAFLALSCWTMRPSPKIIRCTIPYRFSTCGLPRR